MSAMLGRSAGFGLQARRIARQWGENTTGKAHSQTVGREHRRPHNKRAATSHVPQHHNMHSLLVSQLAMRAVHGHPAAGPQQPTHCCKRTML